MQDDRSDPYMSPPLKRAGDTTSTCLFQGLKTVEEEDVDEEEEDCTKGISASCIYIIVICSLNLLFLFLFKTKEMKEVCVDKCKKKRTKM